ncbi:MAG: DUF5671 domain-containing protein [Candidatus Komeilibacteria bacterium]|nr:DUF5671 domain-containing protein [Candidatus Komeilibacteria bacterium]
MDDKQNKTTPKDVFLHLLSIVTLYFVAGNFIALLFQYINVWLPQFPEASQYYSGASGIMRFAIASLIVVFPSYLLTVKFLNKDYSANPAKLKLAIRRWLIYFTLFITALIIIGDLVALINRLLEGEYTLRFLLKVLAVGITTGAIFIHYWWDLKETVLPKIKYFHYAVVGLVTVAVVAGFFIIGSPAEQRKLQFDERRVNDLSYLQSEILNYWQSKEVLPTELSALNDELRGVRVPQDPENNTDYEYEVKGPNQFALCATFNLSYIDPQPMYAKPQFSYDGRFIGNPTWEHQAGKNCFERTIDEDFFKLKKSID